ncbi:MAG: hypothetical protein CMI14_04545 [Oleispira sp.]|nr:hypothetical protein [Oleispira sp.]
MCKFIIVVFMIGFSIFSPADTSINISDKDRDDFIGYAYDLKTKNLLYTEHHKYLDEMNHEVRYKEANGELFAIKRIDYQDSLYSPNILQRNNRNGELIDIKIKDKINKKISIRYQENDKEDVKKDQVDFTPKLIIDAGFDQYIKSNWDTLVNINNTKKELTIDYLIPSALDHYKLSIKKVNCEKIDNYCFSISASNFFINLFSSDLKLTYRKLDENPPRLTSFQGRSNICDSEGNYQDVTIMYKYDNQ